MSFVLVLVLFGIVWRMVYLNVTNRTFLQAQGDARVLREISIPAYRGMITDRYGKPLAVSTPIESIWVDPQNFFATPTQLEELAMTLTIPLSHLKSQLKTKQVGREFVYLKRHVAPSVASAVRRLALPGVHFQEEYRRYYPEGGATAHVLGLTNVDDQGQEGLELTFNDWLKGIPGKQHVVKDRLGQVVSILDTPRRPKAGRNLQLSLDRRIQFLAFHYLKKAINKYHAQSGSVVVLDVKTGEVLAMVNLPTYNPNQHPVVHDSRFRNRAVTDVFEPGSTIKAFSVVNALMNGHFQPDTVVDTAPGWLMLNGHRVEDVHPHDRLTVSEVLQKSSNIGVTKISLSVPAEKFLAVLRSVGFGQATGSGFPGESTGVLLNHPHWQPFTLATLSFGYGLSVTALQLARAYAVLAADGVRHPVSFLKVAPGATQKSEQVIPIKFARQLREMLEKVTESGGTAVRARVPGYRVAGKTGTIRIVGPHGYEKHHHTGLFVGLSPVDSPRLVTAVVINDPRKHYYYGGLVAAPVFSQVMRAALRILDVPPKKIYVASQRAPSSKESLT